MPFIALGSPIRRGLAAYSFKLLERLIFVSCGMSHRPWISLDTVGQLRLKSDMFLDAALSSKTGMCHPGWSSGLQPFSVTNICLCRDAVEACTEAQRDVPVLRAVKIQ